MEVKAAMTERSINLVVPLAHEATDMRITDTAGSYFGLLRQTTNSHHDRACLANTLRQRGHSVKADFTKTYRKSA